MRSNHWLGQPDKTAAGDRYRSYFASQLTCCHRYIILFFWRGKNGPLLSHQNTWLPPRLCSYSPKNNYYFFFFIFFPYCSCEQACAGTPLLLKSPRMRRKSIRGSRKALIEGTRVLIKDLTNAFLLFFLFSYCRVKTWRCWRSTSLRKRAFPMEGLSFHYF